jgi:serine/threonine protein kinase
MLAVNTILQGRYRVVRQLGQGGMGTVYEAIDERFESQVALKETHFAEESLRRAFEREAHLLNKLRHPAMTRVIDHFREGDGQFLVMDFVEGEDLWGEIQRRGGAFPAEEVLRWGEQLLEALDYIHSQQPPIIHRDIKPQNLKLTGRGQIVLLDFGLAKGSAGQMTTVATSRSVLGYSLAYAPPEQILKVEQHWVDLLSVTNAEEVQVILRRGTDARSDLYSLGATLLHLLTGKMPPNAPTRALSVWSNRADPLEAALDHQGPVRASAALRKAMALGMDERYASAAEMLRAWRAPAEQPAAAEAQVRAEPSAPALPPTIVSPAPPVAEPPEEFPPTSTIASPPPPPVHIKAPPPSVETKGRPGGGKARGNTIAFAIAAAIILVFVVVYLVTREPGATAGADNANANQGSANNRTDGGGGGANTASANVTATPLSSPPTNGNTTPSRSPTPAQAVKVRVTPVWANGSPARGSWVILRSNGQEPDEWKRFNSGAYVEFSVACGQRIVIDATGSSKGGYTVGDVPCGEAMIDLGRIELNTWAPPVNR